MKKTKQFKIFLIAAFVAVSSGAFAQVKIGSNPTLIGANSNLEVEATSGNKSVIQKDNGNVGIGTSTPGNKLEIKADVAGWSGLRFTNINNSSPISQGAAMLGVNASGDVVVTDGSVVRQFITVARVSTPQGVSPGQDIVPNGVFRTNNTIPYNTTTGVATLTVGKTYIITASLHVAEWTPNSFGWIQYAIVNAANNQQIDIVSRAELLGAVGTNFKVGSSGSIQTIYTPVSGAETIKLYVVDIKASNGLATGQAKIREDLFCGYTITEM